ncbi:hypothetical protein GCM10020221_32310 [Streptomyces thioluteus]|uniref:Uncharacterized protein n=1 Tax=Streptomyces thioluteus TaxID=66431 RepID=A0ABP6JJZ2_STRTU
MNQYAASITAVSMSSPVTVENNGTRPVGARCGQDLQQLRSEFIDLRRMGRVVDGDAAGLDPVGLATGHQGIQLLRRTGDHDLLGPFTTAI